MTNINTPSVIEEKIKLLNYLNKEHSENEAELNRLDAYYEKKKQEVLEELRNKSIGLLVLKTKLEKEITKIKQDTCAHETKSRVTYGCDYSKHKELECDNCGKNFGECD